MTRRFFRMIQIRNKDKLVENGETEITRKARTIALRTLEHALSAVDAAKLLKLKVTLNGHTLHAGTYSFDLGRFRNVYVLGGGKASGSMASALEEVLGKRITAGCRDTSRQRKFACEYVRGLHCCGQRLHGT